MTDKIKKIIDGLKPHIRAHGGDIEFIGVNEEKTAVMVKLKGACAQCPMSALTLESGVLAAIQDKYPEIKKIENIA
ncbi:MAG: NifU family protein [bacterium]